MTDTSAQPPYLVERSPGHLDYQLPISIKLVVDYHGRVALLRNERDEWELPGGKPERGESPEHAVCREVAEELGLTTTTVDIIDTWVYEITATRRVFIVSYGTVYAGQEHPHGLSGAQTTRRLLLRRHTQPTHAGAV